MSLETITRTILQRAEAEAAGILAESREKAEAAHAEALSRAEREYAAARAAALAPAERESALAAHQARLEAARLRAAVTQSLVEEAVRRASLTLGQARARTDYPQALDRLLTETIAELRGAAGGGMPPHVQADERDRALVEGALADLGVAAFIDYGMLCWGGVRGRSADGRVTVENTLEARLETAVPQLERRLAAVFEAEEPAAAAAALTGDTAPLAYAVPLSS